jgi:hypothetical protein
MPLPPEFGDLSYEEMHERLNRLIADRDESDPAFQPAFDAEIELLHGALVEGMRARHAAG